MQQELLHSGSSPDEREVMSSRNETVTESGRLATEDAIEQSEAEQEPRYEFLDHGFLPGESAEDLRERYVFLTKRLIKRVSDPELNDGDPPDVLIFLDKSARPVSWLVREFWDDFAYREEGDEPPEKPDMKFLNIDKEQWVESENIEHNYGAVYWNGKHEAGPAAKQGLRSIFLEREPQDDEDVFELPTMLDGKKVTVIDEVRSTGITKKLAEQLMRETYPEAEFDSKYWMSSPKVQRGGGYRQFDNPVWYSENHPKGRAVTDRDMEKSQASDNWRQQRGWAFLSTSPETPDQQALALRRDIKLMHEQVKSGDLEVPDMPHDVYDIHRKRGNI